jgi:hypothetical protein
MLSVQALCGVETVDKRTLAAGAIGMREKVERLEAGGFGKVSVVSVRLQAFARVRRVFG